MVPPPPPPTRAAVPLDNPHSSSPPRALKWLTSATPTNYNMLLMRTLNREMGQPNANQDALAPLLRDALMPARMWCLKHLPAARQLLKRVLEHRRLGVPGVLNFVDARTSWFDAVVEEALTQGGIKQVVVVAAGFDTRAYRFGAQHAGAGVKFWEVDLPMASQKKQQLVDQVLQPASSYPRPTFLAADLSTTPLDAALLSCGGPAPARMRSSAPAPAAAAPAGPAALVTSTVPHDQPAALAGGGRDDGASVFDPSAPTLFTAEGLIYYLPEAAVRELFVAMLRVAAPGSRLAFDFLHQEVLNGSVPPPPAYKVTAASVASKGEPFVSGIGASKAAVQALLASIPSPPSHGSTSTNTSTVGADLPHDDNVGTPACLKGPAPLSGPGSAAQGAECSQQTSATGADAGSGGAGAERGKDGQAQQPPLQQQQCRCFRVTEYLGPRDMVARQLPHLAWDDALPPILSFYSFGAAEVVGV